MGSPAMEVEYEFFHRDIYQAIKDDQRLVDLDYRNLIDELRQKRALTGRGLRAPDVDIFRLGKEHNLFTQGLNYEDFMKRIGEESIREMGFDEEVKTVQLLRPGFFAGDGGHRVQRAIDALARVDEDRAARDAAVEAANAANTGGSAGPQVQYRRPGRVYYPVRSSDYLDRLAEGVQHRAILGDIIGTGNDQGRYVGAGAADGGGGGGAGAGAGGGDLGALAAAANMQRQAGLLSPIVREDGHGESPQKRIRRSPKRGGRRRRRKSKRRRKSRRRRKSKRRRKSRWRRKSRRRKKRF